MRRLLAWLLTGSAAVVPVVITVYALVWLITGAEGLLAPALRALIGEAAYVPGLGLLAVLGVLIVTGALLDIYVGRRLFDFFEHLVERLPVVKTVYGAIRDLMRFAVPQDGDDLRRVVGYRLDDDAWIIGFVTGAASVQLPRAGDGGPPPGPATLEMRAVGEDAPPDTDAEWVSVYFPLSYQIGGYTAIVRSSRLVALDLTVEEAMRQVLTAGVMRS